MALWCLKEAVVKAKGTGINAPPGLKGFTIGDRRQGFAHGSLVHVMVQVPYACRPAVLDAQAANSMDSLQGCRDMGV